jgi:death-on-curing protein
VEAPKQSAFGADQYPTVFEKAAVYARNIISDHPFVDGNKRSGITTVILFLQNNGQAFAAKPGELEDFAVQIATDHLDIPVISAWLQEHCSQLH